MPQRRHRSIRHKKIVDIQDERLFFGVKYTNSDFRICHEAGYTVSRIAHERWQTKPLFLAYRKK